jgi:hypothetical protein
LSTLGIAFALLWTVAYIFIYRLEPFNAALNLFLLNFISVTSALSCASLLTLVVSYYEPGEPPRKVWLMFALAIWAWTAADTIWSLYNMSVGEVPALSAADLFWIAGYVFFTFSLISQFQLIRFERSRRHYWMGAIIWLGILLFTTLVMFFSGENSLEQFFAFFYPIADFAVGVAAISLALTFRRGTLARPWLALFGFVVADSLYLWATLSGSFDWVSRSGWLTLLSELIYVIAYLFLAWAALSQYLALRFGATIPAQDTKPLFLPK